MAEAFHEEESVDQVARESDGSEPEEFLDEGAISVLLLATKWQFDTYGVSTVNRSLVNNLRFVDPDGKKMKITCAVVEEEETTKNKNEQRSDAKRLKVKLIGAIQPRGYKEKPDVKWLDQYTATYYGHVMEDDIYDYIVGHSPYLANGCLNFKDKYPQGQKPKIILIVHGLPKTSQEKVNEELLKEWLIEADCIFSVGQAIYAEIAPYITSLESDQRPEHKMYIAGFPLEFFEVRNHARSSKGKRLEVTQNVTLMSGEVHDLSVTGLDFPLAVAATTEASRYILDDDGVQTNLFQLAARNEDVEPWEQKFRGVLDEKNLTQDSLKFQCSASENYETFKSQLRKSNLFLFPSKSDSPIFGTECLVAIAAGVPVLVSVCSGIGSLFRSIAEDDSLVKTTKIETWRERILKKLLNPGEAQQIADRLREKLLLDTSIANSHLDFVGTFADKSCLQLKFDCVTNTVITKEHIDKATKLGVEFEQPEFSIAAQKYILAFFQKFLFLREKLHRGLLSDYLEFNVVKRWQDVVSTMESSNRKLLATEKGSLIFKLFCPTEKSKNELKNKSWIGDTTTKIEAFVHALGLKAEVTIREDQSTNIADIRPSATLKLQQSRHLALSDKRSEGYGSMMLEEDKSSYKVRKWLEIPDYLKMGLRC